VILTIARRVTVDATIYLLILVVAFIGIVIWVFGRKRKARFEADARIPFHDDKGSQS
jgi:cytochrome c oxidase cbb3-type subunit 4